MALDEKAQYIQVQPSLINLYIDLPVYIVHPSEGQLVRFVPRKEQYARRAIQKLVENEVKVYVKLADQRKRSDVIEKRLADYLQGPIDRLEAAVVVRDITLQLVNEFLAASMSDSEDVSVDSKSLARITRLAEYYVRLLDLDNAEDILKILQKTMVKDLTIASHSINMMILALRLRHRKRRTMYDHITVPKEIIGNRFELEEKAALEDKKWALACLLHDVGKVNIPKEVLKAGPALTPEQANVFKEHVNLGWKMIRSSGLRYSNDEIVKSSLLQHHERLDGSGYPLRLKSFGEPGQVMGLLDSYELLCAENQEQGSRAAALAALTILKQETQEGKFDPALFSNLVDMVAND